MKVDQKFLERWQVVFAVCATSALTACGAGGGDSPSAPASTASSSDVQISVQASDANSDTLHYRWAATEGTIANVDSPTTTWTPPASPGIGNVQGLHFVYVLVSDGKGGYAERRIGVLTQHTRATGALITPTRAASASDTIGYVWGSLFYKGGFGRNVYIPGATVKVGAFTATTDFKGEFFIPNVPVSSTGYAASYTLPGRSAVNLASPVVVAADSLPTSPASASFRSIDVSASTTGYRIAGHVELAGASSPENGYCGIRNEFFTNIHAGSARSANALSASSSAQAELLTAGNALVSSASVNHFGDFLITGVFSAGSVPAKVRIKCESATPVDVNLPVAVGAGTNEVRLPGTLLVRSGAAANARPIIVSMSATRGGTDIGRPDIPTATKMLPEMANAPGDDAFLSFKGLDTRLGACNYYRALGAVEGCDADGYPVGRALTHDSWQRTNQMGPYQGSNAIVSAIYINRADLNLGRDMKATKLAENHIAYDVCNYPGPLALTRLSEPVAIGAETQDQINESVDRVKKGIGLIACVSMEYSITPGLNGNRPFTKFYTFGPSGQLLLSVSLDGRREKFLPGVCVACHGGDAYGGRFPDVDAARTLVPGKANIESYFLPFDADNFYFSTAVGLTRADLEPAIKQFNTMLSSVPSTVSTGAKPLIDEAKQVVQRWYHIDSPPEVANLDGNRTAPVYQQTGQGCSSCHGTPGYDAVALYRTAIAPNCRVCHLTNSKVTELQFGDSSARIAFENYPPSHYRALPAICGGQADLARNHVMPNAMVTYERFWLNVGGAQDPLVTLRTFAGGLIGGKCPSSTGNVPAGHPAL